jgi:hypothetical protein
MMALPVCCSDHGVRCSRRPFGKRLHAPRPLSMPPARANCRTTRPGSPAYLTQRTRQIPAAMVALRGRPRALPLRSGFSMNPAHERSLGRVADMIWSRLRSRMAIARRKTQTLGSTEINECPHHVLGGAQSNERRTPDYDRVYVWAGSSSDNPRASRSLLVRGWSIGWLFGVHSIRSGTASGFSDVRAVSRARGFAVPEPSPGRLFAWGVSGASSLTALVQPPSSD